MAIAKTVKTEPKTLSLLDFAHDKRDAERRESCVVCRLPAEIRAQIKVARDRKVERAVIVEWLKSQGHKIDDLDFTSHNGGQHDQREARRRRP